MAGKLDGRRPWTRAAMAVALVAAVAAPLRASVAEAIAVPSGFSEQIVFSGLNQPTNIEFAPDGRVFVAEKGGVIKVFDNLADPTPDIFANLSAQVHNQWDRGLLGMALAPNFPSNPWVYVLYTYDAPPGQTAPVWNDVCPDANNGNCVVMGRLSRLQANGNVMTGSEQVLLTDWCQQFPSHSIGDLKFGQDGALYVSSGDGASFNNVDYGQFGTPKNPCGDPPGAVGDTLTPPTAEGGALRSQDSRTSGDPTQLNGTVLRLDPATGAAAAGNPNIASADLNTRRIVAQGLRNPFRLTMRPGTNEVWAGEVGWNTFEEVNRVTNPTAAVTNFGWPCYEGPNRMASYDNANLTLCETLYSGAGQTAPYLSWNHSAKVVANEACPSGGSSAGGLAFYPTSGGPYPAQYAGALFFSDYTRRCIWAMKPSTVGGLPDPANIETFGSAASSPVDLAVGPGGELYYADLGGTVRRIRYTSGNQSPVAVISASATSGAAPLAVNFSATGSTDPDPADQGRLTYAWDFTNDGTTDSTAATASFTYTNAGTYTARLTVTDTLGTSNSTTVTISSGNGAPTATITTPSAGTTWAVGDQISFSGGATDPQQGTLPASALSWNLQMHHCYTVDNCHVHPLQTWTGVASGSFTAPDHEYPSYLDLTLTATDAGGLTSTVVRRLDPKTVNLTFATNPTGLQLSVGPTTEATPFTRTVIQGSANSVSAPSPQTVGSTTYTFSSWSNGGGRTQVVTAPTTNATYTATFTGSGTSTPCGTDSFGYVCTEGARTFLPADGGTVWNISGDEGTRQVNLPFPVKFYGGTYNTAWIDANGVLAFQSITEAFDHGAIPSAAANYRPNNALYPMWSDLWVESTSQIRTATVGTAPNRQFIAEWRDVSFYSNRSARVTFEAVIHENGTITFAYSGLDNVAVEQGSTSTVGIENATGTVALQYALNQTKLRSGNGVTFTPPTDTQPPAPGTITGTVTAGGQPVSGATVSVTGTGLSANTAANGTYTIGGVASGSRTVTVSSSGRCGTLSGSATVTVPASGAVQANIAATSTPKVDGFGYRCTDGPTTYVPANGTVLGISGDEGTVQVSLPFPVKHYGTSYSTAWVDANGVVGFSAFTEGWSHGAIPSAAAAYKPNNALYPMWSDLWVESTSSVRTATVGSAPNRQFIVEWRDVSFYDARSARVSFEVIFNENGPTTFAYTGLDSVSQEQGATSTVGIENSTGTVAFQYSLNEAILRSGNGVTFTHP